MKRVLAGSLLGRGAGSSRIFGTRLELVESYLDTGVPYVVHRLCSYIEVHGFQSAAVFRLSGGSPRLAERLRAAFERRGDADLEAAGCPPTAATLLRQYLKELPQPVVPSTLVGRLINVHARKNHIILFLSRDKDFIWRPDNYGDRTPIVPDIFYTRF